MHFSNLTIAEREERARRVDFAMNDSPFKMNIHSIAKHYLKTNRAKVKEDIYRRLSVSSRLGDIFHAAVLIRENYAQWQAYLQNPSLPPPQVFSPFIGDKLLVFFLFYSDCVSFFNLDPQYQFFICRSPSFAYANRNPSIDSLKCECPVCTPVERMLVLGNTHYDPEIVKSIVEMYFSLGSPMNHNLFGEYMVEAAKSLERLVKDEPILDYMYHFDLLSRTFGFSFVSTNCKGSVESRENHAFFDMGEFVREASLAIAYDQPGINTLENIYKLFPQYQDLVGAISRSYIMSATSKPVRCPLLPQEAHEVLEEKFECKINYSGINKKTGILNQSIIYMMRKHPELYTKWSNDKLLSPVYCRILVSNVPIDHIFN